MRYGILLGLGWWCGLAAAQVRELPEPVTAFLADPVVAAAPWDHSSGEPSGRAVPVTSYSLRQDARFGSIEMAILTKRVVAFKAPPWVGPVPAQTLSTAAAEPIARAFLQTWLPEVLAEGADGTITAAPTVASDCTWRFVAARRDRGFLLPTRGEVGVRVTDGKVAYWQGVVQPVTLPANLGVTEEQARETVTALLAKRTQAVTLEWLTSDAAVVQSPMAGWRAAWVVSAEVRTKEQRHWARGPLNCWSIDAETGEVLQSNGFGQVYSPEGEAWYRTHGGQHAPALTAPLPYQDLTPLPSPDGRRILFLSTRPRRGYPAWREPSRALFVVDLDGGNLRCLVADPVLAATWSPDGGAVAYTAAAGLMVLDLATRTSRLLLAAKGPAVPGGSSVASVAWLPDGRLAVLPSRSERESLVTIDPQHADAPPSPLLEPPRRMGKPLSLAVDGQGRLLLLCAYPTEGREVVDTVSLWAMDPRQPDRAPKVLVPYLTGVALPPRLSARAVLKHYSSEPLLLDLKVNDTEPWVPPRLGEKPLTIAQRPDVPACYLADDRTLIVSAPAATAPDEPGMPVLWYVPAGGAEPRMITRPSAEEVPLL